MPAAGHKHTVLLRSDGRAVACGRRHEGQCDLPELEPGISYTGRGRQRSHSAASQRRPSGGLWQQRRGSVRVAGARAPCELHPGRDRGAHTVRLRSDGRAVARGHNGFGRCDLPRLEPGASYTRVAARGDHTVLLRSDGRAVACGYDGHGQCKLPGCEPGASYTHVAAGGGHTVLLRSDGRAVACGWGGSGLPQLDSGGIYTQVAAGDVHTVLLRSDGRAVACGNNYDCQCDLPQLELGKSYTQVAAGDQHTVLLRSDGRAVTCGINGPGWFDCPCDLPELEVGMSYCTNGLRYFVLQLIVEGVGGEQTAMCRNFLTGEAVATCSVEDVPLSESVLARVRAKVSRPGAQLRVVASDASLISESCTWADIQSSEVVGRPAKCRRVA